MTVIIQASKYGWNILWNDGLGDYANRNQSAEENFKEAYNEVISCVGDLKERK